MCVSYSHLQLCNKYRPNKYIVKAVISKKKSLEKVYATHKKSDEGRELGGSLRR